MGKRRKTKRVKRSHMLRFSQAFINTGRGPNHEVMNQYQQRARPADNVFDRVFGVPVIKPNQPKLEAERKRELILFAESVTDNDPVRNHVFLLDLEVHKVVMFHNNKCTQYILMEMRKGICRRSLPYGDRKRCVEAFRRDRVRWVEHRSSPT